MTDLPPDPAPESAGRTPADPVQILVSAVGNLPPAERDLVYAWLLRRGAEPAIAVPPAETRSRARLRSAAPRPFSNPAEMVLSMHSAPGSEQQMVPVRFPSGQHAQLREWCTEHGFSMATVIRGLVARFLEGQVPGSADPPPA